MLTCWGTIKLDNPQNGDMYINGDYVYVYLDNEWVKIQWSIEENKK